MFQTRHHAAHDSVPLVARQRNTAASTKLLQYLLALGLSDTDAHEQCHRLIQEATQNLLLHVGGEQNALSDMLIYRTALSNLTDRAISGELAGMPMDVDATRQPGNSPMSQAAPVQNLRVLRRCTYTAPVSAAIECLTPTE